MNNYPKLPPAPRSASAALSGFETLAFDWIRKAGEADPDFIVTIAEGDSAINISLASETLGDSPRMMGGSFASSPGHFDSITLPTFQLFKDEHLGEADANGMRTGSLIIETNSGGREVQLIENIDGSLTIRPKGES